LAQKLPKGEQETYLKSLAELGVSQSGFNSVRTQLGSADSIHRAFLLYAKHQGLTVSGRVTLDNLKAWKLTEGQKYSLSKSDLEAFQKEIILQAAELFPEETQKTRDFFEGLAQKLPKGEQETYLKSLAELGVSESGFTSARTKPGSADSIHRAFLLYAKHKGHTVKGSFTLKDLEEMEIIPSRQ